MDFRNSSWFGIGSLESARFPARRFDSGAAVMLFMGFVPWATSSIAVMLYCCSSAVGSRGWGGRRVVVYGALVVAERTWRHCVSVELSHNVGGGIPPLLFLLGMAWFMTGMRRSICLLSAPFWWHYSLCDDARYPAILWLAADRRVQNDYPDDYNEKAEQELTAKQSSCSTYCRTNCCGISPSPTCRLSAALRHPRLVTDLSERG